MKMSPKAETALAKVVEQFQSGDISPFVEITRIELPPDAPARKWSWGNRTLALATTGQLDCRGYRQWQQIGRQVKKGTTAGFIFAPITRKVTEADPKTGQEREYHKLLTFKPIAVHAYKDTDGEPIESYDVKEPPPLLEVAQRFGVEVSYDATFDRSYGSCNIEGKKIRLHSQSPAVFFHELAHAVDAKVNGKLKGGQHSDQETTAELAAAVLMHVYGLGDHTGNAWQYIQSYNKDPLRAITDAADKVGALLAEIFEMEQQGGDQCQ